MKTDRAVKQGQYRVKTGLLRQAAGVQRLRQSASQKVQALDVPSDGEQAPAVIARHAVCLGAGQRRQQATGVDQHALGLHRIVRAVGLRWRQAVLGLHHQAPVLGRHALAHPRSGQHQGLHIESHAGAVARVPHAGHQRPLEHAARLLGRRHARRHQAMLQRQGAEPGQQGLAALVLATQGIEGHAAQAHGVFGALGIAAHPKQIFSSAAGDDARTHKARGSRPGQHRGLGRRWLRRGQHPHVGTAAAALHGGDAFGRTQPGQSARQHGAATGLIGQGKDAQNHRPRAQAAALALRLPHRRVRQRQKSLQSMRRAVAQDAARPFVALALRQRTANDRLKTAAPGVGRVAGLDHALVQARQGGMHGAGLAAPPARHRRQLQLLAQHLAGHGRHKAQQGTGLQKARTRRIGQQHIATAHRLQQAGHPQRGVSAQLQRIEPVVIHALEQSVHALQALQGFEVELFLAHQQITALHQAQAQVAGQVSVLKIGFVVGPGREQGDMRIAPARGALADAAQQALVGLGHLLHAHGGKSIGKLARDQGPVFQQIAQPRGRLRALRQQPPAAVGTARQVKGGHAQMAPAHRCDALHGVQVAGVALHQRGRQHAAAQQVLGAVDIGHRVLEQAHALLHAALNLAPAGGVDDQRKQVQRPGALGPVGIGIHVVGDAVVMHLALQLGHARRQTGLGLGAQMRHKRRPRALRSGAGHRRHAVGQSGQGAGGFHHASIAAALSSGRCASPA